MSHVCINCGSDKVERQDDDFTCLKCQFHWDVALEQANKVYLRSQGRQPATSVLASEAVTTATNQPTPALVTGPSGETNPTPTGVEVPGAGSNTPENLTDPVPPPPAARASGTPTESTAKSKKG